VPLRVLIVDDSLPFRRAAREVLEQRGYEVVGEAGGVAAAVEAADEFEPDAALVDLRLPGGSGFEVSAAVTAKHPDLAVLLVSADHSAPSSDLVAQSGARGYVLKSRLGSTDFDEFWPSRP
jgi:DNA-binding NarL/FixJ family response regulator